MTDDFSLPGLEQLHFMILALRLPLERVEGAFPDETACFRRLAEVRWPSGPACLRCGSPDLGYMEERQVYHCRSCRRGSRNYHFSARVGTLLQGKHVPLRTWFRFAEIIIISSALHSESFLLATAELRSNLRLSRKTIIGVRPSLLKALAAPDGGLLGRCICVRPDKIPAAIQPGTVEHASRVQDAVIDRFVFGRTPPE